MERMQDGLADSPGLVLKPRQLPGVVCCIGGAACPLLEPEQATHAIETLAARPAAGIRLVSDADTVPHYTQLAPDALVDPGAVFNRKRDLDVLQRLGLAPGDTRRARYLFELLFERIHTLDGLCAYDTPDWEGCPVARQGVYEKVREGGWQAVVHARTDEEMAGWRAANVERIRTGDRLFVRPHHVMCYACGYAGGDNPGPRPNDTLYEIFERIRREPDVPLTLVEGCCMACDCCDGFDPESQRCVHAGGLLRDYKKDLDLFQRLGLMPGATLPAREAVRRILGEVQETTEICGYGDGEVTSEEWRICSGPEGNPGYRRSRDTGLGV